jgi:hypothetical protein
MHSSSLVLVPTIRISIANGKQLALVVKKSDLPYSILSHPTNSMPGGTKEAS